MSTQNKKVFVGLSGGVDSAVSAALLKKQGYNVTAVFVRIALPGYPCSAGEDRREALRVAAHLQIPFVDIDLSREYQDAVFKISMDAYRRGETPNPDALCNREIKFGLLYDFAIAHGADFLATGHYARLMNDFVSRSSHERLTKSFMGISLFAGKDPEKDQSYFLWAVPEERLRKTLFPVGNMQKKQVRALAKKFRLPNAERKDSQGLCFLGGVSMEDALMRELAPVSGDVLNADGKIIGTHDGAVLYTMGERHGFDVHASGSDTEPLYVVAKDITQNTITVNKKATPLSKKAKPFITLREENWIGEVSDGAYEARFRYRQKLVPARLFRVQRAAQVEIDTNDTIPLGQSLVLYDGERCLGGGVITATSH